MGGLSLIMVSLQPLWHSLRGMFGLSLLFYGEEFATLAFHIIVFRLSGWKKVRVHVIGWERVPVIIWKKTRVRSAVPEGTSNAVSKRACNKVEEGTRIKVEEGITVVSRWKEVLQ